MDANCTLEARKAVAPPHTPGPWEIEAHSQGSLLPGCVNVGAPHAGVFALAVVVWEMEGERSKTNEANARLIAEAPELLRALEDVLPPMPDADAPCHRGVCEQKHCFLCGKIARAHAVILKVRGGAK